MTIENETQDILEQGDVAVQEPVQEEVEQESTEPIQEEGQEEKAEQEAPKQEEPKPEKHKLTAEERQRQIAHQTKLKWEAQRALETEKLALQKERAELEAMRKQMGVPEPDAPPDPKNYTEDQAEKYVDDLATWKANKIASEKLQAERKKAEEENAKKQADKVREDYNKKWSEKVAKDPSFKERELDVYRYLQTNGLIDLANTILEDDNNVDLIDHLGKNLGDLEDLATLPPLRAAKELGKITARLGTPQSRTVSKANAPINPVRQTGNNAVKPVEMMSHDEYSDYMNKKQYGF